jgi:hypothetical protein
VPMPDQFFASVPLWLLQPSRSVVSCVRPAPPLLFDIFRHIFVRIAPNFCRIQLARLLDKCTLFLLPQPGVRAWPNWHVSMTNS